MTQVIDLSLSKALDQLQESMFNSMGSFYVVSSTGVLLCCNQTQLDWIGLNSIDELIGKTGYQTPWEAYADQFETNNKLVIKNLSPQSQIEYCGLGKSSVRLAISCKSPFYHRNKLIGIKGRSMEIPLEALSPATHFSDKTLFVNLKTKQLVLLSSRRREILFYTLKGLTAKEIASYLNISHKTVEHNLEFIRETLCLSSSKEILLYIKTI